MGDRWAGWGDEQTRRDAVRIGSRLLITAGVLTLAAGTTASVRGIAEYDGPGLLIFGIGTAICGGALMAKRLLSWPLLIWLLLFASFAITFGQVVFAGAPSFGPVLLLWPILVAFAFMPRRWAWALAILNLSLLAAMFALQEGWQSPFGFWVFLAGTCAATAWVVSELVARAERAAQRERAAREELAAVNATLEQRVETQVDEMQRLARLRRFLSPDVADAVLSAEGDELAPHRAEIAVLFCDLRGFTAFSSAVEPEDVTSVLHDFHRAMGGLVEKYNASVGGFAGDGVWLYFNDPVPIPDPVGTAVRLALDLEPLMTEVRTTWAKRGFAIDYGVGISLGHATMAITGFDTRRDYTALGNVVNLASRLSDEARGSEILLDPRANAALGSELPTEPRGDLVLKGFAQPVKAYRVIPAGLPR